MTKMDELNIMHGVNDLFKEIKMDNRVAFLDLAKAQYRETEPHGDSIPDLEWLLLLLAMSDPVTKYIYENEVDRKRERMIESILSGVSKSEAFRVALSYWSNMTGQYADTVTDNAQKKAYDDAGVKKVRWVAQIDGRECEICRERNGKIYSLKNVPPKPHWHCRCTLEPILE